MASLSFIAFFAQNRSAKHDRAFLKVRDLSENTKEIEKALDALPVVEGEKRPESCDFAPARSFLLAEGVERTFVPANPAREAKLALLKEIADHGKVEPELRARLIAAVVDGLACEARAQGADRPPVSHLGRLSLESAIQFVAPSPIKRSADNRDEFRGILLEDPLRERTATTCLFFRAEEFELSLRENEARQLLLRVEHDKPCLLRVEHVVSCQGQEESVGAFNLVVQPQDH